MTVFVSQQAKIALQRMPTPKCSALVKSISLYELDAPAADVPGISGTVTITGSATPTYWRRAIPKPNWQDTLYTLAPEDDLGGAEHWIIIYRNVSSDECINYAAPRAAIMVLDYLENGDLARRL